MKRIIIALFLGLAILAPGVRFAASAAAETKTVVYYFHGQFRCFSCTRIEELTNAALKKFFARELASGAIVFRPINIDQPKNEHYIKDYRLETRSVVVSKVEGGKEITWKNLSKVWNYLNDEKMFMNYIQSEVATQTR